jgi:hypothetical protein
MQGVSCKDDDVGRPSKLMFYSSREMNRGEKRKTLYIEDPSVSPEFREPFREDCWTCRGQEFSLKFRIEWPLEDPLETLTLLP